MMIKRPMKGPVAGDLRDLRYPLYASPKLDGFRCVLGQRPLTSRLALFPNKYVNKVLKGLLPEGVILDGEITVGRRNAPDVLRKTSSGVTSVEGKPDFTVSVFDCYQPGFEFPFEERLQHAREWVERLDHDRIRFHRHRLIPDWESLQQYLDGRLERGYEGIITRLPSGLYKEGKSTPRQQWMFKVKPFEDAEGVVVDYFEEQHNTNELTRDNTGKAKRSSAKAGKVGKGRLGGLVLRDIKTKQKVRVGGGFTDELRTRLWEKRNKLEGAIVKYKKQSMGEGDKPRHPVFLDFRPEWDL